MKNEIKGNYDDFGLCESEPNFDRKSNDRSQFIRPVMYKFVHGYELKLMDKHLNLSFSPSGLFHLFLSLSFNVA